jgi:hypothetical protein
VVNRERRLHQLHEKDGRDGCQLPLHDHEGRVRRLSDHGLEDIIDHDLKVAHCTDGTCSSTIVTNIAVDGPSTDSDFTNENLDRGRAARGTNVCGGADGVDQHLHRFAEEIVARVGCDGHPPNVVNRLNLRRRFRKS